MRREKGFAVSDRIQVNIQTSQAVQDAFKKHYDYITNEILAVSVDFGPVEGVVVDLNGEEACIAIEKK